MRGVAFLGVLFLALVTTLFSIFGSDSYPHLLTLGNSLLLQEQKNVELGSKVTELKRRVFDLRHDERAIEKAARNELGMARPDELIIFFDRRGGSNHEQRR